MQIIHWVPGVVATPAVFAIPVTAPDIDAVIEASVKRVPQSVGAHAGAADLVHTDTGVVVTHANCAVDAHADHAHELRVEGTNAGIAPALGWDAIAPIAQLEDAGAISTHTLAGGLATGIQDFTVPAHTVNPQPDPHTGADILASVENHTEAEIAAVIADHAGVDPDIGAIVVVKDTARTIHLDTSTQIDDILVLTYHEVGSRIAVA